MNKLDNALQSMTFDFFGNGKHKISPAAHLSNKDALFLDVRSEEEVATISLDLTYHMDTLHLPIDKIPEQIQKIPHDKNIGIFCSSGVRSTMVYLYLKAQGFENIRIIEGGYPELLNELKPGKLLKQIAKNQE